MSVSLYGSGQTVIQVVNNTVQYSNSAYFSTSSSTLVSTGLSVTITPQSTTSKILILVTGGTQTSNAYGLFTVYRNSTNLATGTSPSGFSFIGISSGTVTSSCGISVYDSPSTTSATTYTLYAAGNGQIIFGGVPSLVAGGAVSITAIEISGS